MGQPFTFAAVKIQSGFLRARLQIRIKNDLIELKIGCNLLPTNTQT